MVQYTWTFGDGSSATSQAGWISHDYTNALARDLLYTNFDVQVDAHFANGFVTSAKRTIAIFNTYGFNKVRRGILTPRVAVQKPLNIALPFFAPSEVICIFTVTNLEDEEISFVEEKQEWLTANPADNPAGDKPVGNIRERSAASSLLAAANLASKSISAAAQQVAPKLSTMDLRVSAGSTISVVRVFPQNAFSGTVFGVAIHLSGFGMCSKLPAISSA